MEASSAIVSGLGPERERVAVRRRGPRERALEAAVRIASVRGFEGTSIADVLDRAELTEPEFGAMFASKQACFLEAYDALVDILVAHASAAYRGAAGRPWPERIAAGLRAMVGLMASEPEIVRMALLETSAIGEDGRVRYRAALERFVRFLEQGRAAAGHGDELPQDTARFAIGGCSSIIFGEVRAGRASELRKILPDLVFAATMPYLGVEQAEAEMRRVAGED